MPYRMKWATVLFLSGAGALLTLVNPYLTKFIIDQAIEKKDFKLLVMLVVIGGSVFLLQGLAEALSDFLKKYIKVKVTLELHKQVIKKTQAFHWSHHLDRSSGEYLYRISNDIERVCEFTTTVLPKAVSIFPRLVFVLAIIFSLNWQMAALSLALAPFMYVPAYVLGRRMRRVWKKFFEHFEIIYKNLQEILSRALLVKSFAKEKAGARRHIKLVVEVLKIRVTNIRLYVISIFTIGLINKAMLGIIAFYGGTQVIKGAITLGSLMAIMVYLAQLVGLKSQFAYFFQDVAIGLVSCQRVADVLDEPELEIALPGEKKVIFEKGEIVFDGVTFAYPGAGNIFNDVALVVPAAGCLALTGPSGCGKTTWIKLLLRLHELPQGKILIDGCDIRDMARGSLREQIGVAWQEPMLWNDTIANNMKYGNRNASQAEIAAAAEAVGLSKIAWVFSEKYETIVGENACRISEGQKQQVALARALIKNPKILVLDEAMSAIDLQAQMQILRNIRERYRALSLVIISQRIEIILFADVAGFFCDGRIVSGNPRELLRRNAALAAFFTLSPTPAS